ncbi:MAG TPA: ribosome maturation factor RimM [Polyangiales bacterium]
MEANAPSPDEPIALAAVVRAHGLRGELLLKPFNPGSTLLTELERVLLKAPDGRLTSYVIDEARNHGDGQLLALKGVQSREAAEALRGHLVCVKRGDLPALEEGEVYLVDLVGLTARDARGADVGVVADVIEYPSVTCLVLQSDEGTREVPNLPRYVLSIDLETRAVVVDQLDELELERPKAR